MNAEKQREQLHKLLDIVIDGNGFEHREREYTGTLPTLFLYFSGHVNNVSMRVFADGWQVGAPSEDYDFNLDYDISDERIEAIRERVNKALETKNLADVLRRGIEQKEKDLEEQKKELANMKNALREAEKKEGVA